MRRVLVLRARRCRHRRRRAWLRSVSLPHSDERKRSGAAARVGQFDCAADKAARCSAVGAAAHLLPRRNGVLCQRKQWRGAGAEPGSTDADADATWRGPSSSAMDGADA